MLCVALEIELCIPSLRAWLLGLADLNPRPATEFVKDPHAKDCMYQKKDQLHLTSSQVSKQAAPPVPKAYPSFHPVNRPILSRGTLRFQEPSSSALLCLCRLHLTPMVSPQESH